MTQIETAINETISKANKIIVFSHIRPDWDAISSNLLASEILRLQFPEKVIVSAIEKCAIPNGEYLPGYQNIETGNAMDTIEKEKPDVIIMTDCPDFTRISFDKEALKQYFSTKQIPLIGIDHHPRERELLADYISNHDYNDAVEEVHTLFVKTFGYAEPKETPKYMAAGILNDTNNFMFLKENHTQTLQYVDMILNNGYLLDEVSRQITRYTGQHLLVLSEFFTHYKIDKYVTYFWISDEFFHAHPEIPRDVYSISKDVINHYFLRNISFNEIFLVIYPENTGYKGSFRALINRYDTTVFAKEFGGGGQKPAAGFNIDGVPNITTAIQMVLEVVEENLEAAKMF